MATAAALTTTCACTAALRFDDVGHLVATGENALAAGLGLKRAFVADTALAELIIRIMAARLPLLHACIAVIAVIARVAAIALWARLALVTRFALLSWRVAPTILATAALTTLPPLSLSLPLIAALALALRASRTLTPKGRAAEARLLPVFSLALMSAVLLACRLIGIFLRRLLVIAIPAVGVIG